MKNFFFPFFRFFPLHFVVERVEVLPIFLFLCTKIYFRKSTRNRPRFPPSLRDEDSSCSFFVHGLDRIEIELEWRQGFTIDPFWCFFSLIESPISLTLHVSFFLFLFRVYPIRFSSYNCLICKLLLMSNGIQKSNRQEGKRNKNKKGLVQFLFSKQRRRRSW